MPEGHRLRLDPALPASVDSPLGPLLGAQPQGSERSPGRAWSHARWKDRHQNPDSDCRVPGPEGS